MLIKSLGIDPEDMKRKGEQIYEWVAGKIESIDSALIRIEAQNQTLLEQNARILSVMGIPEHPTLTAQKNALGLDSENTNAAAQQRAMGEAQQNALGIQSAD